MKQQLSILIPVYNRLCTNLVMQIDHQAKLINDLQYEIIIADDASTDTVIEKENRIQTGNITSTRYIQLETNKGRSAIRNYLAQCSKYRWLLFLDCHVELIDKDFLKKYLDTPDQYDVICGGIRALPAENCRQNLRYKYEKSLSNKFQVSKRADKPYQSFRTTNFLISRDVMLRHPFDETIKKYGYEDVVYGYTLENTHTPVLHIDNPVAYREYESNDVYLRKIEEAVTNLYNLSDTLYSFSPLLRTYKKLKTLHVHSVIKKMSPYLLRVIKRQLTSKHPSVLLFQIYKLIYLTKTAR